MTQPDEAAPRAPVPFAPATATGFERWVPWLLALVLLASLPFLVHGWYDWTNDSAMYLACARSVAAGEGYTYLGAPFLIRPPGFAWLLAPWLGAGGTNFLLLNGLVALFGAVGVLALFRIARARLGTFLALLVALVAWTNPSYRELSNQLMSDVPGTALLFICLLLGLRWRARTELWRLLVLGAAIGLATYVRSANLFLVPALVLSRWFDGQRGPWRRELSLAVALVLGAVVVQAPWSLRNRLVAPDPPADQTLLYSYSSGMWHTDMGDPGSPRVPLSDVLGRFSVRSEQISANLGARLTNGRRETLSFVLGGLFIGVLLVSLLRHRRPEDFYGLATLAIVAFYFGYASRLLLPVYLLGLVTFLGETRDLVGRFGGRRVGVGAAALVALTLLVVDFAPRRGWGKLEERHVAMADLCARLETQLAPDAVLASHRGWFYSVYLARPVYSLEFALKRAQAQERPDPFVAAEELIDKYGINTVLLAPLDTERQIQGYFRQRYGPVQGPEAVVRVR